MRRVLSRLPSTLVGAKAAFVASRPSRRGGRPLSGAGCLDRLDTAPRYAGQARDNQATGSIRSAASWTTGWRSLGVRSACYGTPSIGSRSARLTGTGQVVGADEVLADVVEAAHAP